MEGKGDIDSAILEQEARIATQRALVQSESKRLDEMIARLAELNALKHGPGLPHDMLEHVARMLSEMWKTLGSTRASAWTVMPYDAGITYESSGPIGSMLTGGLTETMLWPSEAAYIVSKLVRTGSGKGTLSDRKALELLATRPTPVTADELERAAALLNSGGARGWEVRGNSLVYMGSGFRAPNFSDTLAGLVDPEGNKLFSPEEIAEIAGGYHAYEPPAGKFTMRVDVERPWKQGTLQNVKAIRLLASRYRPRPSFGPAHVTFLTEEEQKALAAASMGEGRERVYPFGLTSEELDAGFAAVPAGCDYLRPGARTPTSRSLRSYHETFLLPFDEMRDTRMGLRLGTKLSDEEVRNCINQRLALAALKKGTFRKSPQKSGYACPSYIEEGYPHTCEKDPLCRWDEGSRRCLYR